MWVMTGVEIFVAGHSSRWRGDCSRLLKFLGKIHLVDGRDYRLIDSGDGSGDNKQYPRLVVQKGNHTGLSHTVLKGFDDIRDYLCREANRIRRVV